jgi:hypothetical protein
LAADKEDSELIEQARVSSLGASDVSRNESREKYPVSESFKILDGYDIYRSNELIVALVAVEGQFGRDLRLYRWQKRKDAWKVDLCRMSVSRWDWDIISSKAKEMIAAHGIRKKTDQASDR